jgi:hypothetical protein
LVGYSTTCDILKTIYFFVVNWNWNTLRSTCTFMKHLLCLCLVQLDLLVLYVFSFIHWVNSFDLVRSDSSITLKQTLVYAHVSYNMVPDVWLKFWKVRWSVLHYHLSVCVKKSYGCGYQARLGLVLEAD